MKYVLCTANKDAKTIDDLKEFAVLPREWVDGSDVELGSRFLRSFLLLFYGTKKERY